MPGLWVGFGSDFALSPVWAWLVGWPVCGVWIDVWWSLVFWFLGSLPRGEDVYHISCGFVGLFNR